jgi:hypothetical protein
VNDIVLTITLHPDGRVDATGPLDNKIICFGMLEVAKQVISGFQASRIEVAAPFQKGQVS